MNGNQDSWRYWSVDLPGLNHSSAKEVLEFARHSKISQYGSVVDPHQFLTLHFDRQTVESIYAVLSRIARPEETDNESVSPEVIGFRDLLEEWLDYSVE